MQLKWVGVSSEALKIGVTLQVLVVVSLESLLGKRYSRVFNCEEENGFRKRGREIDRIAWMFVC